jgi:4-hydroxy-tetrahydrodipicolinate reductase
MKIALIGYGKMGKVIESVALQRNHKIVLKVDYTNVADLNIENLQKADVAIEFTTPLSTPNNIIRCFEAAIPVVCGTTGWMSQWSMIEKKCNGMRGGLFYASNFSVGVNIFFEINQRLARLLNPYSINYSALIQEIHHAEKKDSPSGTAITLANDIVSEITTLKKWVNSSIESEEELQIESVREGNIVGTHIVKYESEGDEIIITHIAKNRTIFAVGAVLAAEFMMNKIGIYTMKDLLNGN